MRYNTRAPEAVLSKRRAVLLVIRFMSSNHTQSGRDIEVYRYPFNAPLFQLPFTSTPLNLTIHAWHRLNFSTLFHFPWTKLNSANRHTISPTRMLDKVLHRRNDRRFGFSFPFQCVISRNHFHGYLTQIKWKIVRIRFRLFRKLIVIILLK